MCQLAKVKSNRELHILSTSIFPQFSFFLALDLVLGTCSFFSRYTNVLTQVTGHTHVTSQAVGKHLLQVTISLLSRFCFLSNPTPAELQSLLWCSRAQRPEHLKQENHSPGACWDFIDCGQIMVEARLEVVFGLFGYFFPFSFADTTQTLKWTEGWYPARLSRCFLLITKLIVVSVLDRVRAEEPCENTHR